MNFYVGLDDLPHAKHFERVFISVNRLWKRKSAFECRRWIMDSGAFTEISSFGLYRETPETYAREVERWKGVGELECAVTQDYMCEPFILEKTGLSVAVHQSRTIQRFDAIRRATSVPIMPVLQGFALGDYLRHLEAYGERLVDGMRVGIGSVCKRNTSVAEVEDIVSAIHESRPAIRLHGFGLKTTALASSVIWDALTSADSMAWSFSARKQGRDAHDWREAKRFVERIESQPRQGSLFA